MDQPFAKEFCSPYQLIEPVSGSQYHKQIPAKIKHSKLK